MRVLVGCEFSGIVRNEFEKRGHDAWSFDYLPTEIAGNHIRGDVRNAIDGQWDLALFFPPCTHLAVSGARWFKDKLEKQREALTFVMELLTTKIPKVCLENPVSVISTKIRKPDQIIQPWQFGEPTTKATCLWLRNLPKLKPTKIVNPTRHDIWMESPGPDRWKNRSRTYPGIARAMAEQWS